MRFLDRILLLEVIDRAKRGRGEQAIGRLMVLAARLMRQRKPLPPELADFIAEQLDPQEKKSTRGLKGDRLRRRDNEICRAVKAGRNIADLADEYRRSYDRIRTIARERRSHLDTLDKLEKLGNDLDKLEDDILKNNILSPRRR